MLIVRLQRVGRKNDPSFRVVVVDSRRGPQSGQYLEMLGSYNARQKTVNLNKERILHWIGNGAQVSDTMHNILVNERVIDGKKVNVLSKKTPIAKESPEGGEAAAPAEASSEASPDSSDTTEDVGKETTKEAA